MTPIVGVPRLSLGGWRTLARSLPVPLLVAAAVSCNRDEVAGPNRPTAREGPSRTTTVLGTFTMPIYETNTQNNGTLALTPTGYIIPANSYFRVRIRGSVIVTSNQFYLDAYGSNCCSEDGTYGPGGTAYVNELRVQAQIRYTDNSGTIGINFPGLGFGPTAPDSAVSAITFTSKQAEVWIGRNGINGSQNDNGAHGLIGMYHMEGTQTATVELLTDFVHLTPTPAAVHAGQMVHFQMALDDGTPATVWQWSWTKDPGSNANPLSGCANAYDFCNGTVWGPGTLSGRTDYGWASAHVIVYSNFTLDADRASVHVGDTVRFTPKYDGAPGPAARWRWAPAAGSNDSTACANGVSPCKKAMLASGTMWAYTSTTPGQGDSASAAVTVVPGRITLTGGGVFRPGDVATFTAGSTVGALVVTGWEWRPPTGGNGNRLPLRRPAIAPTGRTRSRSSRTVLGTTPIIAPCSAGSVTCVDTVAAQGQMWVFGTVDGAVDSTSVPVILLPPEIAVICSPDPQIRGQTITCTPSSPTGGAVAITRWRFHADSGPLGDVLEQDNPVPQTWVGPAVASGTVTVEGTVNGVSAISDTARVNVSERGFTIPIDTGKAAAIDTTLDCFSTPVYGAGQKIWGWVRPPNRCDVVFNLPPLFPNPESSDTTGATIASVPSGPNRGLWYVSQFLTKLWLRAQVMKDLRSNAPTYLATTEDPVGIGCGVLPDSTKRFTTLYADTVCKQNNGGSQHLSYVWHHEGCHMARNSWVSTSDPATRVRFDSIDRAVFMDSASVRSRLTTLLIFVRDSSWNYGKRIDTDYPVVTYNVWTPSTANNGGWVLQAWPIQGTVEPNTLCR